MKLKLMKISTKPFMLIFAVMNVIAGLVVGALISIVSLMSPSDQNAAIGVWAVVVVPIMNGVFGLASGFFLTGLFNFLSKFLGGIEMEFNNADTQ